jgi:hypothetical protein
MGHVPFFLALKPISIHSSFGGTIAAVNDGSVNSFLYSRSAQFLLTPSTFHEEEPALFLLLELWQKLVLAVTTGTTTQLVQLVDSRGRFPTWK